MKTQKKSSMIDSLRELPQSEREDFIKQDLTSAEAYRLLYDWQEWARPDQLPPPGDWFTWLIMTGRGWGKNRTAAETIRMFVEQGEAHKMLFVSKNPQDVREDMIEEERSGILAVFPPKIRPDWQPGNKRLVWPDGTLAHVRTGAKPDNIRGSGYDLVWMDEIAAWDYPRETYQQVQMACRRGNPREIITTTPQPIPIIEELLEKAQSDDHPQVVMTTGTTWENEVNLSDRFMRNVVDEYRNTRLGKQELEAQVLTSEPNALWSHKIIQYVARDKIIKDGQLLNFDKVCVSIDPATTSKSTSDETGIIVSGKKNGAYFVIDDYSGKYTPHGWASTAIKAYHTYMADRIVAEKNQGGDMVKTTIQDMENVPVKLVHASRGKKTRAEPIASIYEQGKVYHVDDPNEPDLFEELERQYTRWVPGDDSPDRLDSAVWGLTWLKGGTKKYRGGSPGNR